LIVAARTASNWKERRSQLLTSAEKRDHRQQNPTLPKAAVGPGGGNSLPNQSQAGTKCPQKKKERISQQTGNFDPIQTYTCGLGGANSPDVLRVRERKKENSYSVITPTMGGREKIKGKSTRAAIIWRWALSSHEAGWDPPTVKGNRSPLERESKGRRPWENEKNSYPLKRREEN